MMSHWWPTPPTRLSSGSGLTMCLMRVIAARCILPPLMPCVRPTKCCFNDRSVRVLVAVQGATVRAATRWYPVTSTPVYTPLFFSSTSRAVITTIRWLSVAATARGLHWAFSSRRRGTYCSLTISNLSTRRAMQVGTPWPTSTKQKVLLYRSLARSISSAPSCSLPMANRCFSMAVSRMVPLRLT